MIVLIDNYDSFVHNLGRYLVRLGQEVRVIRNDQISAWDVARLAPEAVVLSPGPCTPLEAGNSLDIVRHLSADVPMLGVCLGHQTIAAAFGADIVRAKEPVHGRASEIHHDERGVFEQLPNPLTVARYHSLEVDRDSLPDELEVSAWGRVG